MNTPYKLAKDIGVAPSTIYKRMNRLAEQLEPHITRHADNSMTLSDEGEKILRDSFKRTISQNASPNIDKETLKIISKALEDAMCQTIEQNTQQIFDKIIKPNSEQHIEQLQQENKYLKEELAKSLERYNRLSESLATITQNTQILLKIQQEQQTVDEIVPQQEQPKKNLFQRLFNKQ